MLKTDDFSYDLPQELIAQEPVKNRDDSRLMILNRNTGSINHKKFYNIIDYLNKGDCLVLNDSKVLPARIYGVKSNTGASVEFLLLHQVKNNLWEVMVRPAKRLKSGVKVIFGDGILNATIEEEKEDGIRIVEFSCNGNIYDILEKIGNMPLPPYITKKLQDKSRYQTVYCNEPGSAAAPTAGLHFTEKLLESIREKGVKIAFVTLHVGLGTFKPVKVDNVAEHKMHTEHYIISQQTAEIINNTKSGGGKIVAVGTTSCRTLESAVDKYGNIHECEGDTDIFIYPGYKFKVIDALVTNFHLPKSTLIMLISAFCGRENVLNAYKLAVKEKYRFFSFGDAMMII